MRIRGRGSGKLQKMGGCTGKSENKNTAESIKTEACRGTQSDENRLSRKKYPLYDINETQVVKQRQTDISKLEMTIHNIAESLYIINKSAKKSRDTKKINYFDRNYGVVNRAKTRQLKLYALKDAVLRKLLDENKAEMIGYHTQNGKKLLLIQLEDYTFHLPAEQGQTKCLKHLGEIAIIPAAATRKVTLKYNEAVKLLETFLQKD